jgi:hypothetical protein
MKNAMKRTLCVGAIILSVMHTAQAALVDRGNGMIYDSSLNITWLQDANYAMTSGYDNDGLMTWQESQNWVNQLSYGGYSDWRIAGTANLDSSCSNETWPQGTQVNFGYNCSGSGNEMGHLYYNDLNGIAYQNDWQGDAAYPTMPVNDNHGLGTTGLFTNIMLASIPAGGAPGSVELGYWSDLYPDPSEAWHFHFGGGGYDGYSGFHVVTDNFYSWAVRDGDVATTVVPVPAAAWLFVSGLLSLIGFAKRKKA